MLTPVVSLEGMAIKERLQILWACDDVLPNGDRQASGFQDAGHLSAERTEIPGMMENLPGENEVELTLGKRQVLAPRLHNGYFRLSRVRNRFDCPSAHYRARVGLQCRNIPAIHGESIRCDATPRANVERLSAQTWPQDAPDGPPFGRPPIPVAGRDQRIVEEKVFYEVRLSGVGPDVIDRLFPRHGIVLLHDSRSELVSLDSHLSSAAARFQR